ncbi:GntR family transcriptional regulator [Lutimonas saemankumensis]|uniref:GntR family transcriptional regulator n=1 Tax=Lutimonas saemankumensis TaxID=483016 RepID=UPI001CD3E7AE|nr:GntR family transcriptional regulator [Lutimonas saemankumensis]MCA0932461.1 GntR family transcriptional regulator [Lutimonas saemankumensis]
MSIVSIKDNSGKPKYKQIIASIEEAIVSGALKKGDKLPSLNSIKLRHKVSRDTVFTAFNELRNRGIIQSVAGKGFYVASEDIMVNQKIFLLFDELNSFKEDLYNSFLAHLGDHIQVDIFFHHFNSSIFSKLIYDNIGDYSYYVIMPANLENTDKVIDKLPDDKVYILDQTHNELSKYPAIYQNFEKDIHSGLNDALKHIQNYERIILLFDKSKQPEGILTGFKIFCKENKIAHEVVDSLESRTPKSGEIYVIPDDRNLIKIIKSIREQGLVLANEIGIISYNDTLLKEIVEGGITTISTDFNEMGKRLAEMILKNENLKIENPNRLILRRSI